MKSWFSLLLGTLLLSAPAHALVWRNGARSGNIEDRRPHAFYRAHGKATAQWLARNARVNPMPFTVGAPSHGGQIVRVRIVLPNTHLIRTALPGLDLDATCDELFNHHDQGINHRQFVEFGAIVKEISCATRWANPFILYEGVFGRD